MKEQTRNTDIQINEEEIGKLPEREFRIMIVKMIKNLENKMEEMQESVNKDIEELKNKHTERNNTITEIKTTLEGINSRIPEAEERISELEDKMVEIISEEQNKVKRMKRTDDSLRDLWDNIKWTNIQIIGVPEEEGNLEIWKTQQRPQDWKRSVFIPNPKKGNAKECSDYCTIAVISHTSKLMLKILQARLKQYVN